jgi:hypothetical protein
LNRESLEKVVQQTDRKHKIKVNSQIGKRQISKRHFQAANVCQTKIESLSNAKSKNLFSFFVFFDAKTKRNRLF